MGALNEIKKSVVEKKQISAPEPTATAEPTPTPKAEATPVAQKVSTASKSIRIKASGPGRISLKYDSWLKAPYFWKLIIPESGKEIARFDDLGDQMVRPGEYQIVWRQTEHGGRDVALGEVVKVSPGETTEVNLLTSIRLILPDWVKEPYYWNLVDLNTNEKVATFRSLDSQLVPPGEYQLNWRQEEHGSSEVVLGRAVIEPDTLNELSFITGINITPADWVPGKVREWALLSPDGGPRVARFYNNFAPQLVSPGLYKILYRATEHGSTDTILGEIEVRADVLNEFSLNTGVRLIGQEGLEAPYMLIFIQLDGEGKEIQRTTVRDTFGPVPLPAGTYSIKSQQKQHGSMRVTLVESFELPEGNLVEIEM